MTDAAQKAPAPKSSTRLDPVPGEWKRVSPKYVVVDLIGTLIGGAVMTVASGLPWFFTQLPLLLLLPAFFAVMALVLHYVVDPPTVLAEVRRTLKPGGRLVLVDMRVHDRGPSYAEEMGHVWPGFEADRVGRWLQDAGFDAVRVVPLPPARDAVGPLLFLASAVNP
ncbi:MAG: methyltransferase domain-containing protein [Rhodoglobus sp.]